MKEADVALIAPNTLGFYKFSGKNRENLAIGMLGAYLEKNDISFELIDARLNHQNQEQVLDEVIRLQPLIVGITLMGQEPALWSGPLVKMIREELPKTHIVTGSYFPTLDPKKAYEIMPEMDSIVLGEGEDTLVELHKKVKTNQDWTNMKGLGFRNNGQIIMNPRRRVIQNLDTLPAPIRYAKGNEVSKLSLEGSRGCIGRCAFCTIGPLYDPNERIWRGKSPKKIVDELSSIRKQYPDVHEFRFVDADAIGLPGNADRIDELSKELINAGFNKDTKLYFETQSRNALAVLPQTWQRLHEAGLHQVFFGIENSTEKVKHRIGKSSSFETDMKAMEYLKGFGINVTYGFIMLNPWSDIEDIKRNTTILKSIGNAGLDKYFSELILTPGTRAYEMIQQEYGIVNETVNGVDVYSYPLPQAIDSIRKVGRQMLENSTYKNFLERIATQYNRADSLLGSGQKEAASVLRSSMDQLSFNIFTDIIQQAERESSVFTHEQVERILSKIMADYIPVLNSYEI